MDSPLSILCHDEGVLPNETISTCRRGDCFAPFATTNSYIEHRYIAFHIQEHEPRLCLDPKLLLDCPGITRQLTIVPVLADSGFRFDTTSQLVGFEVYDSPL